MIRIFLRQKSSIFTPVAAAFAFAAGFRTCVDVTIFHVLFHVLFSTFTPPFNMAESQEKTDSDIALENEEEGGIYDPLLYDASDIRKAKDKDVMPAKVIALVRQYDVIYDVGKQVHRKKQVLLQAWGSIAKTLKISSKFFHSLSMYDSDLR